MAKKKPKLTFKALKGRAQDIVLRLSNSIALQDRDCCTLDDFAEEFKTTPGRLKTTLKRLEEAGLLVKRPSPVDRRRVRVFLQPQGEQEVARVAPFTRLINDVLFKDINPDALRTAQQVARQLILNSESALAEIRKHHLQRREPTMAGNGATVTSRGAKRQYPAVSRSSDRSEGAHTVRRGKAKASSPSG